MFYLLCNKANHLHVFFILYLPFIADSMAQKGWKNKEKGSLKREKSANISHNVTHLVQTRPRYVTLQNVFF